MTELTKNMKPRCIGRYVIDMPNDLKESGDAKIQGVRIKADEMSEDEWRQEIAKRESDLRATRSQDAFPFLYEAGKGGGEQGYYFVHRGTVFDDPSRRYIEGYKWSRGVRFLLKFEAYDYLHPNQTDDSIVKKMSIKNNFPDKLDLVLGLMTRLRARLADEIPHETGVCFPGGFLQPSAHDDDDVEVSTQYGLGKMKDVFFTLYSSTKIVRGRPSFAQESHSARASAALHEIDGKNIRIGSLDLSGLPATEWLFESRKPADTRGHTFSLGVNETDSGPNKPYLSIELSTGGALEFHGEYLTFVQPSLTTAEAVALWDSVTRTLRFHEISGHETVDQ